MIKGLLLRRHCLPQLLNTAPQKSPSGTLCLVESGIQAEKVVMLRAEGTQFIISTSGRIRSICRGKVCQSRRSSHQRSSELFRMGGQLGAEFMKQVLTLTTLQWRQGLACAGPWFGLDDTQVAHHSHFDLLWIHLAQTWCNVLRKAQPAILT